MVNVIMVKDYRCW